MFRVMLVALGAGCRRSRRRIDIGEIEFAGSSRRFRPIRRRSAHLRLLPFQAGWKSSRRFVLTWKAITR